MGETLFLAGVVIVALGAWRQAAKADAEQAEAEARADAAQLAAYRLAAWAAMDHRIANASPEKIQSIYQEIFAPVRPSPLDSWMHVEAETDEAAADLLAAKLGGKS